MFHVTVLMLYALKGSGRDDDFPLNFCYSFRRREMLCIVQRYTIYLLKTSRHETI